MYMAKSTNFPSNLSKNVFTKRTTAAPVTSIRTRSSGQSFFGLELTWTRSRGSFDWRNMKSLEGWYVRSCSLSSTFTHFMTSLKGQEKYPLYTINCNERRQGSEHVRLSGDDTARIVNDVCEEDRIHNGLLQFVPSFPVPTSLPITTCNIREMVHLVFLGIATRRFMRFDFEGNFL